MVFEQIDRLKREYTDKYVIVDDTRPELRRFQGQTGTVRTVNMSGRALVEFDARENIGWYDIELDFLKVVDQPLPKAEQPAAKPAKSAAKPAAKPAPAKKPGSGLSVEEMLAAARGEKAGVAPAKAKPGSDKAAPAAPAKAEPQKMSVEEILAAARSEKDASAASADTALAPDSPAEPPAPEQTSPEQTAPEPAPEESTTEPTSRGDLPTATADIVEYCRQTDAG